MVWGEGTVRYVCSLDENGKDVSALSFFGVDLFGGTCGKNRCDTFTNTRPDSVRELLHPRVWIISEHSKGYGHCTVNLFHRRNDDVYRIHDHTGTNARYTLLHRCEFGFDLLHTRSRVCVDRS